MRKLFIVILTTLVMVYFVYIGMVYSKDSTQSTLAFSWPNSLNGKLEHSLNSIDNIRGNERRINVKKIYEIELAKNADNYFMRTIDSKVIEQEFIPEKNDVLELFFEIDQPPEMIIDKSGVFKSFDNFLQYRELLKKRLLSVADTYSEKAMAEARHILDSNSFEKSLDQSTFVLWGNVLSQWCNKMIEFDKIYSIQRDDSYLGVLNSKIKYEESITISRGDADAVVIENHKIVNEQEFKEKIMQIYKLNEEAYEKGKYFHSFYYILVTNGSTLVPIEYTVYQEFRYPDRQSKSKETYRFKLK